MTLTRKGELTRTRIVLGASAEILESGVEEVRLEDIMARTATSKSQLFHYFPGGREELVLAVTRHETEQALAAQTAALQSFASWDDWQHWRDDMVAWYHGRGLRCPLLGLLSADAGRRMPEAQAVMTEFMTAWQAVLTEGLRRLQATGRIAADTDVESAAAALLAGIQGGILLMITTKRIDHLEAAIDQAAAALRA
ncbi:TetR family transcriptional regulator C-terminal domain-containing protein [Actinoplanes sp. Pm04-4]|uniref:TetR family transcriptional regulator C-terminal domain-containing protein n=1 Tax=Paractinoplanes pyxinae TaxID=2997416 RepID=A0ABT4BCG6_9ACTN|nr:TetR family transcriptional regulator C-terminal domain-containing protein [Actinoplanes pyxinae]MCY1143280.1 TetR family transcriptional regulator C-terminal domain-containing protein [Actinoplanes pyxinae]